MQILPLDKARIFFDKQADLIPFVSTVTNLVDIFQKYFYCSSTEPDHHLSPYYTYVREKRIVHCALLLVPVVGNFASVCPKILDGNLPALGQGMLWSLGLAALFTSVHLVAIGSIFSLTFLTYFAGGFVCSGVILIKGACQVTAFLYKAKWDGFRLLLRSLIHIDVKAIYNRLCRFKNQILFKYHNREFVLEAMRKDPFEFYHASKDIKNDKSFILRAVNQSPSLFVSFFLWHIRPLFNEEIEDICKKGIPQEIDESCLRTLTKLANLFDERIKKDFVYRLAERGEQSLLADVAGSLWEDPWDRVLGRENKNPLLLEAVIDRAIEEKKEGPLLSALRAKNFSLNWKKNRQKTVLEKCVENKFLATIDELIRHTSLDQQIYRAPFKKAHSLGIRDVAIHLASTQYPGSDNKANNLLKSLPYEELLELLFSTGNIFLENLSEKPITKQDLLQFYLKKVERANKPYEKIDLLEKTCSVFEVEKDHYKTGYKLVRPISQPEEAIPLDHLLTLLDELYKSKEKKSIDAYCSKKNVSFRGLKDKLKKFIDDFLEKKVAGGQELFFDEAHLKFQRILSELKRRNDSDLTWSVVGDFIETSGLCVGGYDEVLRIYDQRIGICIERELTSLEKIQVELARYRRDCFRQAAIDQNPRVERSMESHQHNQALYRLGEDLGIIGSEEFVHEDPYVPDEFDQNEIDRIFHTYYNVPSLMKRLQDSIADSPDMQKSFFELMAEQSEWQFNGVSQKPLFEKLKKLNGKTVRSVKKALEDMGLPSLWSQIEEKDLKKKGEKLEQEVKKIIAQDWMDEHLQGYYGQGGAFKAEEAFQVALLSLLEDHKIIKLKNR